MNDIEAGFQPANTSLPHNRSYYSISCFSGPRNVLWASSTLQRMYNQCLRLEIGKGNIPVGPQAASFEPFGASSACVGQMGGMSVLTSKPPAQIHSPPLACFRPHGLQIGFLVSP